MPTIIVRRLPMPSVSIYLILSITMLAVSIMWANNTLIEEQELLAMNKSSKSYETADLKDAAALVRTTQALEETNPPDEKLNDTTKKKSDEYVEIWSYPKRTGEGDKQESSFTFSVKRDVRNSDTEEEFIGTEIALAIAAGNYTFASGVLTLMLDEPLCLMVVVNATYCMLVIFMQIIQAIVFGKLRPTERQHMKDKFWNFVFYKFIFIFGVMNVQSLNEVLIWVSWFTAIAFLLLLTKLSKDRFEFLSFSPNTPMYYHWKVVGLLVFILLCCILLAISCVTSTFPFSSSPSANYDIHSITFMFAECVIISVKAVHVITRYAIHLYDVRHDDLWERKATVVYHVDLVMELLSLSVNFVHHLHMLFSGNIWLSMASLVICMQLRFIFSEIQKRFLRHKNYRRVVANMEAQFPEATKQELDEHEDRCAICWDQMETARKLPCGHLYHAPCLRSWLEQDTTCPTCRKQLGIRQNTQRERDNILPDGANDAGGNGVPGIVPNPTGAAILNPAVPPGPHRNHFWHFDGSRFASWLPSFSVEVTHSPHGAQAMVTTTSVQNQPEMSNSQLDSMVRDVQEIFPQIPARVIANDLRITASVEATTLNILEGNITVPPDQMVPLPPPPTPNSQAEFEMPAESRPQPTDGSVLRRRNVQSSLSDLRDSPNPIVLPAARQTSTSPSTSTAEQGESSNQGSSHGGAAAVSGRFSKAPHEREVLLQNRRDILVRQARLRYLNNKGQNKPRTDSDTTESAGATSSSDVAYPLASYNTNELRQSPSATQSSQGHLFEDDLQFSSAFGSSVTPPGGSRVSLAGLNRTNGRVEDRSDDEMSEESLG